MTMVSQSTAGPVVVPFNFQLTGASCNDGMMVSAHLAATVATLAGTEEAIKFLTGLTACVACVLASYLSPEAAAELLNSIALDVRMEAPCESSSIQ